MHHLQSDDDAIDGVVLTIFSPDVAVTKRSAKTISAKLRGFILTSSTSTEQYNNCKIQLRQYTERV